jgi:hypothetical protein
MAEGVDMTSSAGVGLAHLRVARPSDDLAAVLRFYRDGLGLDVLYEFQDHEGFDGVMLEQKGSGYHLEFTRKAGGAAKEAGACKAGCPGRFRTPLHGGGRGRLPGQVANGPLAR